ncbi:VapC toxin family PIN domain ribonuclease [Chroococcidiopsis sp. CCALA 051]|nr:VapC toxin family PIN domain ribonuclease [Chroococcidiopsis sp. CCALA 051]
MSIVVADMHTIIWYLRDSSKLSAIAIASLDAAIAAGDCIYISSISVVEIAYLVEKIRLPEAALNQLIEALSDPNIGFAVVPLSLAIAQAIRQLPRDIVSDMPDRIIAATALNLKLPLVTRDEKIRGFHLLKGGDILLIMLIYI